MPITVLCPTCSARSTAPDAASGKQLKCPKCGNPLIVPAPMPAAPPIPAPPAFEVVDDSVPAAHSPPEDRRPRREAKPKSHYDDEDEPRQPRRAHRHEKPKGAPIWLIPLLVFGGILAVGCYVAFAVILQKSNKRDDAENAASSSTISDTWEGEGVFVRAVPSIITDDVLLILVEVRSTYADKRINYRSWADMGMSVTDSKGNRLASHNHDLDIMILRSKLAEVQTASSGSGPIDPDRPRFDFLYFDLPISSAESVTVELSGRNVGSSRTIKLRLTKEQWKKR